MGRSTDALYFFGLCPGEDDPLQEQLEKLYDGEERSDAYKWLDEHGLQIDYHCSIDYPMYFMFVKNTHTMAWRGSPRRVEQIEIPAPWLSTIEKAVEHFGLTITEGPHYYIASCES